MLRNTKAKTVLFTALLFSLAFLFLFGVAGWDVRPVHESGRDFGRALDFANGIWIWYGPEFKYGGYSPGPFLYWLTSLPFLLGGGWRSVLTLELLLAAVAATLLFRIVERRHSRLAAFFAFVFFLNGMTLIMTLNQFWNSSFVFVFDVMLIGLLWNSPKLTRKSMATAGVLLGVIIQMHALQALLILDSLASIFADRRLERRERFKVAGCLMAGLVVALAPYLIWRIVAGVGDHTAWISQVAEAPLVADAPWSRFVQLMRGAVLQDVIFLAGFATVFLGRIRVSGRPFFLLITAVVTLPIFLKIELKSIRYAIPLFLATSILISTLLAENLERSKRNRVLFLVLCAVGFFLRPEIRPVLAAPLPEWTTIYFACVIILTTLVFFAFRIPGHRWLVAGLLIFSTWHLSYIVRFKASMAAAFDAKSARAEHFEEILAAIKGATGWTFEELRPKLYITGESERSLSLLYHGVSVDPRFVPIPNLDGVIAVYHPPAERERAGPVFPTDITDAIASGRLECVRTEKFEAFDVCFYRGRIHRSFPAEAVTRLQTFEATTPMQLRGSRMEFTARVSQLNELLFVELTGTLRPSSPVQYGEYIAVRYDCNQDGENRSVLLANRVFTKVDGENIESVRLVAKAPCARVAPGSIDVEQLHLYRRDRHIEKSWHLGGSLKQMGTN